MSAVVECDASELLTAGIRLSTAYRSDGVFIVRNLLPLDIINAIAEQIASLCELLEPSLQYDQGDPIQKASHHLKKLDNRHPGAQGAIYDAISQTPIAHRAAQHPALLKVIQTILSQSIIVHPRLIVLMSLPEETWHLARWHQDYFYNAGPQTTCTVYAPLQPVSADNGGLIVAKGSHQSGLFPHGDDQYEAPSKWKTLPATVVSCFTDQEQIVLQAGDVLFFHSLVAHTAQTNRSADVRVVLNLRYRDLTDPGYLGEQWRTSDLSSAREALARRFPIIQESPDEPR